METIGVVYNPLSAASVDLSVSLAERITARGLRVWRGVPSDANDTVIADLDLIIALGGDGTVLRAARMSVAHQVPVLPVALGHLNFMAELLPDQIDDGLTTLLAGGGWRDERTLLTAYVRRTDGTTTEPALALNEVLLARGDINRVVAVDVEVYQSRVTTYHADGVLVATATGSTAYALAAGGPIVDPRSKALVLVPVAAHLTPLPSLVLHEDAVVHLTLRSRHVAAFSADGRNTVQLEDGDEIIISRAAETCIFARVFPLDIFYARLAQRLRRDP